MNIHILKSREICQTSEEFLFVVGRKHWNLGIQVHEWGTRIMLIWWHICIHKKPKNQ